MFAVFKTGGKQYRVAAEDVLKVDKIPGEPVPRALTSRIDCKEAGPEQPSEHRE